MTDPIYGPTEELGEDPITAEFIEEHSLVDPESEVAKEIGAYLKQISDRLLIADGIDPATQSFRFFLSHDKNISAFIVPHVQSPPIVLSKAAFLTPLTEDEIAAALRHEIQHYNLQDYRNSKIQEQLCDFAAISTTRKAGYNPLGIARLLKRLRGGWEKNLLDFFDEHPDHDNRIRDNENLAAVMDRKQGDVTSDWTSIDSKIIELAASIISPVTKVQQWFDNHKFEEATDLRKIVLVDQFLWEVMGSGQILSKRDRSEFRRILSDLIIDSNNLDQKKVLDEFIDHLLIPDMQGPYSDFYKDLPNSFTLNGGKRRPLGRLEDLDKAVTAFLDAKTKDEAEEKAAIINTIASRYAWPDYNVIQVKDSFDFQSVHNAAEVYLKSVGAECLWARHVEWAKQSETKAIGYALQRLGFGDDYALHTLDLSKENILPIHLHSKDFLSLIKNQEISLLQAFSDRSHLNLKYDQIISLSEEAHRLAIEERRMAAKDRVETILVAKVDWDELKTNFRGFVDRYSAFLIPEITTSKNRGQTFATEFMKRMYELIEQDPTHRNNLNKFLFREHDFGQLDLADKINTLAHNNNVESEPRNRFSPKLGVNLNHPLVRYIIESPDNTFSSRFKSKLISLTPFLKRKDSTAPLPDQLSVDPETVFKGITRPPTFVTIPWFEGDRFSNYVEADFFRRLLKINSNNMLSVSDMIEIYNRASGSVYDEFDNDTKNLLESQIMRNTKYELRPEATAQEIAETYVAYSTSDYFRSNDALRSRYEQAILDRAKYTDSLEIREKLAKTLLFSQGYAVGQKRLEFTEDTDRYQAPYSGRIPNHNFRQWANTWLVNALKDRLGLDNGSDTYHSNLVETLNTIEAYTRPNTTLDAILAPLADAVIAQPKTAFYMRDLLEERLKKGSQLSTFFGAPIELSLDELAKNPSLRQIAVEFLTSPLTDDSALYFGSVANQAIRSRLSRDPRTRYARSIFDSDAGNQIIAYRKVHQEFWQAPFELRAWYLDKILFPPADPDGNKYSATVAQIMHRLFPDSVSSRVVHKEAIALRHAQRQASYAESDRKGDREESIRLIEMQKLRQQYSTDLLPGTREGRSYSLRLRKLKMRHMTLKVRHQSEMILKEFREQMVDICDPIVVRAVSGWRFVKKTSQVMRQIAEAYLETIPDNESRLALSAAMAARSMAYEDQKEGGRANPGKFAVQVLTYMDEIGGKILQAIDSHPNVPNDLKKEIGDSKGNYQKPRRWDALQWSKDHGIVAETAADEIAYHGPVIGSGSMGYALHVCTEDGRYFVDTLLRPHAVERTAREARNVVATAKKVAVVNKRLSVAPDIAAVAQRDALIETNMGLAYKQGLIAAQVYHGLRTSSVVNGRKYSFDHRVADIVAFSKGAKRATFIRGTHFNDLPESTQDEKDYKRAVAIQLYGTEIFNILSGKPCDRDRHGKNQKIESGHINHFDFGMTALVAISDEQKKTVTKVVLRAYGENLFLKKDVASSFDRQLQKIQTSSETKNYLSNFRRQILSFGDFDKYLTREDKKDILFSILKSGKVDPIILSEIQQSRLGRAILNKAMEIETTCFKINDSKCVKVVQMPILTSEELQLIGINTDTVKVTAPLGSAVEQSDVKPTSTMEGYKARRPDRRGLLLSFAQIAIPTKNANLRSARLLPTLGI